MGVMAFADMIASHRDRLTGAERRAAEVILRRPELVAFGTVATLAAEAGVGGATVVRLTAKLGLGGFGEMQELVQQELSDRLHPAVERIRHHHDGDIVGQARTMALNTVAGAFDRLDPAQLQAAVRLLGDRERNVWMIGGDDATGIVSHAADVLGMVRPGVEAVSGSPVGVARRLAHVSEADVIVAVDLRRYDTWLVHAVRRAIDVGAQVVAITDGPLSPLVPDSAAALWVPAGAVGPFDSYVGVLAMFEVVVASVVGADRDAVTRRLDGVEAAWRAGEMLADG